MTAGTIAFPGAKSITYKKGATAPQDPQKNAMMRKGEGLLEKGQAVKDFFIAADNNPEIDKNPKKGEVYITKAPAQGLIEMTSEFVRGSYRSGQVEAYGWSSRGNARSVLVADENSVFMDRDSHINNSYLDNVESVTKNEDGTLTYGFAYRLYQ